MKKLTLDHGSCSAYWGGQDLGITMGEYRIISKLASKPGCYFSYRDIYDSLRACPGFHAGNGEDGINCNVRSAIKRIRRKLRLLDPATDQYDVIINYLAFGYSLNRDVIDTSHRCPSCGQIVCTPRETVVLAPVLASVPVPHLVLDHQEEVTP